MVLGGTQKHGVPVGRACECCVFAASAELDWPASRGPVVGSEGWGGQGGHAAAVVGAHVTVHVLEEAARVLTYFNC